MIRSPQLLQGAGAHPVLFQATRLSAGYGNRQVLHGLDFTLEPKRTTVILGPGGSGKTTLIRLLSGADHDYGIWRKGHFHSDEPPSGCWMRQRAHPPAHTFNAWFFLSRDQCLAPRFSGGDYGVASRRFADASDEDLFQEFLTHCCDMPTYGGELGYYRDRPLSAMPRPLAQLLRFAVLLFWRHPFMIFDEPDTEVEPYQQDWMIARLKEFKGTHSVVLATHNIHFARLVADHAILLIDGEICEAGDAATFFTNPQKSRTQHFIRMGS